MFVALDIETTGLYPEAEGSKIYCVAVNTGKAIKIVTDIEEVRSILEDNKITKVIHNASFDCYWLEYLHGIKVKNIWDTRIIEQVILGDNLPRAITNEEQKKELSSSLKYTLARYGLANLDKKLGASFATRDPNKKLTKEEIEYVKDDVKFLLQLQAMQEYMLTKLDLKRVAALENAFVEKAIEMRIRGVGMSEKIWLDSVKHDEDNYREKLKRMPQGVDNWNSPIQVKKFFSRRGISMNSFEELDTLLHTSNDPILKQFKELRELSTAISKYGRKWLYNEKTKLPTIGKDGRVHADIEQVLNTGRLAFSNPNLTQLPNESTRKTALVPKKGCVFVSGDFSGQELGVMAAASKEELWIKAMLRDEDVHTLMAMKIYLNKWTEAALSDCNFPKKCKCPVHIKMRNSSKATNFSLTYGGGAEGISYKLRISLKEGENLLRDFKRAAPRLWSWLKRNANDTKKTGLSFSADPYKRRRAVRTRHWTIGMNNPVQSCAANMTKLAIISTSLPVILPIHDEIYVEVKKSEAKKAMKELKQVMEKAADYCTGIKGLIKVSPKITTSLEK